jgi:ATP-binding cassette subfamily B protein
MQRVTGDVSNLQGFMVNGLQDVTIQILTLIFIGVVLFKLNWQLALVTLFPAPFVAFATSIFSKRIHLVWHRIWRRQSDLNSVLADTIPGIRVVKAFGREANEIEKFRGKQEELLKSNLAASRMSSVFYPSIGFTVAIGSVFVWGFGGYQVIQAQINHTTSSITLGTLVAFISYMWQFYGPVQQLSRLSGMLQEASTAAERVFEVLDTQPQIYDTPESEEIVEIKGKISFSNVGFSYEKGEQVLKDITFDIEAGEMVGIVGSSGAGKTTLINLLSRFYDASEGQIFIDDRDIRTIKLSSLRDQLAVVLQEPFLFHGSIAENIAYGRESVTREEIVWAARMANAHDFIMDFPDGYETRLGERGIGLSGGQKQRISIARAILKDPKILILDEATSSVDTETEHLIQEAISRLVAGRTTIAIAHRLSTLKNADKIVVLEGGKLAEMGTHDELLKTDGAFNRLVKMQSEISKAIAV